MQKIVETLKSPITIVWLLVFLMVFLPVLVYCCSPDVDAGVIEGKIHIPARIQIITTPVGETVMTRPVYHPEKWSVTVCNDAGDCEDHSVSEEEFDSFVVGEFARMR